jgi:superfamily I DNA and RNA helicase
VAGVIGFPIIAAADFRNKFAVDIPGSIWRSEDARTVLIGHDEPLPDRESIGYELETGDFVEGAEVVINRPAEHSPNRIESIYSGVDALVRTMVFENRPEELDWVADSIRHDIREEGVAPEEIIVISLDSPRAKKTYVISADAAPRLIASLQQFPAS